MSLGATLGFGSGPAAVRAGSQDTGAIAFASPISPDLAAATGRNTATNPATLVFLGALGWLAILYWHFHVY